MQLNRRCTSPTLTCTPSFSYSQTLPRSGKPQFFLSKPFLGPADTYDHTHVKFNFEDREPYKHLETHRVVDGVTRARIDSKTTLAALYDPKGSDDPSIDNKLIKHLATTVEPRVLCQLETSHGKLYPPSLPDSQCSYQIKVTYSNLVSRSFFQSRPVLT